MRARGALGGNHGPWVVGEGGRPGLALVAATVWETIAFAAPGNEATLPYFAALHADKVNLRAGPGDRYPIEWVYVRRDWPVQVIAHFDHWRRVRDWEGTEGWVQEKMITS